MNMKLKLVRRYNCDGAALQGNVERQGYCIGSLYIDGKYYMDVLEDTDRGLDKKMPIEKLKSLKKKSKTAIPTGTYRITLKVQSPKYSKKKFFMDFCKAMMPRLLNVPAYDGILIHPGNKPEDTDGCVLVGYNKVKGGLTDSTKCFTQLYDMLSKADKNNEDILIEIVRKF